MCLLYVTPYSLMVGQLGSTFSNEGGGLSSWVRGTDGEFLGYFTAWTYWAASIPYAVDSANEIIVDLGWALTGSKGFQDKIPTTMFAALTFVVFIVFIIVEHHFANSMEFLSSIGGGLMVIMTVLFVLLAFVGLAKSGGHMATQPFTWHTIVPKFDLHYWSTVGMLIYAMNGCELVAPYVTKMKKPKSDFPKAMIALAIMTAFLTILGSFALGIYFDAYHIPNDLKMNGAYYVFQMVGEQFGMGKFLLYLWAWTSLLFNCALVAVLLDAMTRMLISDTGDKYMPKFLRKKDKNGLAPQDVKHGSGLWWYELIINIVAVIVLIGLGAILPGIRRREEEYGIAFDKSQWIWMGILIIGSIILDVWLGSTSLSMKIAMIIIEAIIALIATWLVGRRKPQGATK